VTNPASNIGDRENSETVFALPVEQF